MSVGFYDYDIHFKPKKLLLNLEAMKIAAYYNKLGKAVILEDNLKNINDHEYFYIFRNIMAKNLKHEKKILPEIGKNISNIGLAYTNGIYIPLEEKFEQQTAYVHLYGNYLRDKVKNGQLTLVQVGKLLDSHFIRLRAGDFEFDISKLKRKYKVYIYDYEIEKVTDWENKLSFCKNNLMTENKTIKIEPLNNFKFTSFENVRKLTQIPGFKSSNVDLFVEESYKEFKENFDSICEWSSPRDGIKYHFGSNVNPNNNTEVVQDLCLSINKYLYTKSKLKACEFIVDDKCETSQLNKLQKDFQYWTIVRVGDKTLKDYFISRNKTNFDEYYNLIKKTPYKSQFDKLCNITKNEVKEVGWYYHE